MNSKFLKIICSIPIILLVLYFVPFLGICLTLLRLFVYKNTNLLSFSKIIILTGILILVPKIIQSIYNLISFEFKYLYDVVNTNIYLKLIEYSKFLLIYAIILIIIYFILKSVSDKLMKNMSNYISKTEKMNYEISKQNDMKIKEKQERAKNTKVVHCRFCGADNIITEKTGKCKYCRRNIS